MKIIGFIYHEGGAEMVLKGDSCLLNGRKPFFIPDWSQSIGVTECIILRVSRLGKEINAKFAPRYYDAVAPGADFVAADCLQAAINEGHSWTSSLAFDYSLAIGEWMEHDETGASMLLKEEWIISAEQAIEEASKVMTIRQGDLIYIQKRCAPRKVEKEEIIRKEMNGEEKLYCKIK